MFERAGFSLQLVFNPQGAMDPTRALRVLTKRVRVGLTCPNLLPLAQRSKQIFFPVCLLLCAETCALAMELGGN